MTRVEDGQAASSESKPESTPAGARTRGARRAKLSLDEGREIARLYADASVPTSEIRARFGIGESSLYRIIQRQGIPLRGHVGAAAATTSGAEQAGTTARRGRPGRPSTAQPRLPTAQPRPPAGPEAGTRANSAGRKFRIRYLGERVFEAQSIQDALRQAKALGATEITAVTRED